jgi:hypothetical protein
MATIFGRKGAKAREDAKTSLFLCGFAILRVFASKNPTEDAP